MHPSHFRTKSGYFSLAEQEDHKEGQPCCCNNREFPIIPLQRGARSLPPPGEGQPRALDLIRAGRLRNLPLQKQNSPSKREQWLFRAQAALDSPNLSMIEELIQSHGNRLAFPDLERHTFYLALHFHHPDPQKIEQALFCHLERHSDPLVGRLFAQLLSKATDRDFLYPPLEALNLLKDKNYVSLFQTRLWYQKTTATLSQRKWWPHQREISDTLKQCPDLFPRNLIPLSRWILEAEDALNTPSPKENLLQRYDPKWLSARAHRLLLRLHMAQRKDRADYPVIARVHQVFQEHLLQFPEDPLAWKPYIFFLVKNLKDFPAARRCLQELKDRGFPSLPWMQKLEALASS